MLRNTAAPPSANAARLVVLAASTGGLSAVRSVLRCLPADFPAAVVVIHHLKSGTRSVMADILGRSSLLPVTEARHGERLEAGHVLVAPPDHHLLVKPDGTLRLSRAGPVHHLRPSVDVALQTAAASFGPRTVAVVFRGGGRDGLRGTEAVRRHGGTVIAEAEAAAAPSRMPRAATPTRSVDAVLSVRDIAEALCQAVA